MGEGVHGIDQRTAFAGDERRELAISVTTATYNQAWGILQVYTNFLALALVSVAGYIMSSAVQTRGRASSTRFAGSPVAAQGVVLRAVPARLGPVRAASLCPAAGTGAQVGGDLYEAVETRYGGRMIVGDVRGKGLSVMRAVAVALGAFREAAHCEDDLVEVMNPARPRRDGRSPSRVRTLRKS
ncbi:hypothetical protein [Streptomyces sp. V1I1]|uniref:hypothetical protein n=1 Tax=Streptomyces sp. V1I1 TaxID=3042272 RepID=UPI0027D85736|nr:hypothetical protein [Streptomyces sp. V1I1]